MNNTGTILVSGAGGQVGSELKDCSSRFPDYRFVFLSREEFSLEWDASSMSAVFEQWQPDYFINCAAYTAVDKAEEEKDKAELINGTAVGQLAAICQQQGTKLIHISTDYVFDGTATSPIRVDDPVNPVNAYGASKLLGEQQAQKFNPDVIIIRTAWVYSSYGKNFVKTMLRLMKEKPSINVVNDQVGCPTYAADLAEAIIRIITSGDWQSGIYHFTNEGVISWFDFAVAIAELSTSNCKVLPIPSTSFPTPARRPHYSVLDLSAIRLQYGIEPKPWKESLRNCMKKLEVG
jgi:dTDP-4-dehydrorhamnose reductase